MRRSLGNDEGQGAEVPHGAHRQNDSVPLSANLSTSRRGTCVSEQLPSGLRIKAPGR